MLLSTHTWLFTILRSKIYFLLNLFRQAIEDKIPFFVCCGGKQGNQDKPCLLVDPPDPDNIGNEIFYLYGKMSLFWLFTNFTRVTHQIIHSEVINRSYKLFWFHPSFSWPIIFLFYCLIWFVKLWLLIFFILFPFQLLSSIFLIKYCKVKRGFSLRNVHFFSTYIYKIEKFPDFLKILRCVLIGPGSKQFNE